MEQRYQQWMRHTSSQLKISEKQVLGTIALLDDGATVPFIARYRKEMSGSLDEVGLSTLRDSLEKHRELEKRRGVIRASLKDRDLLTPGLDTAIEAAESLTVLEDVYLPFKPKRKTRATMAREKGLEPLAESLLSGEVSERVAASYVAPERGVATTEEALGGARDIVAERISEDVRVRGGLRRLFHSRSVIRSRVVEKRRDEAQKFKDYFDWQEPAKKAPGHRLLALFRGENQKMLHLTIRPGEDEGLACLQSVVLGRRKKTEQLSLAMEDSYSRLLAPSLENEYRKVLKEGADREAIEVFAENLKKLLLAPPLGQRRVMALDPGFRSGAKLVCLDEQGGLLHRETVYPTHGGKAARQAAERIRTLVKLHNVEAIGIGSGTAGRETEAFIGELGLDEEVIITLVNEDGASVYSASETAREEFPDEDVTIRGAISIGRRLQDPLAELVKIDPKAIGVGQYQHDVDQSQLKKSLGEVVEYCVNSVGVEVNSASHELLTHVSGVGPVLAKNILEYRNNNGPFSSRRELLKVVKLGKKAFELCSGFLRVGCSDNPLDNSGVHPERYHLVETMARDMGKGVAALLASEELRRAIPLQNYLSDTIGMETLRDIAAELGRPGRDPRDSFRVFQFDQRVRSIDDLYAGMVLPAVITNVTRFGAFADIGIKSDGLIHISELADRFVKDPAEIVSVRDTVTVKVLEVDRQRGRIGLSMRLNR